MFGGQSVAQVYSVLAATTKARIMLVSLIKRLRSETNRIYIRTADTRCAVTAARLWAIAVDAFRHGRCGDGI